MTLTSFTPSSVAKLFPTSPTSPFRPTALTTAAFPHLSRSSFTTIRFLYPPPPAISGSAQLSKKITYQASYYSTLIANGITYPLSLTRQECRSNRLDLESIRNERAEILGQLSRMRHSLTSILNDPSSEYSGITHFLPKIQRFVEHLDQQAAVDVDTIYPSPIQALAHLSLETIPELKNSHSQMLKSNGLMRPRTLVLMWPKIVLIPPLLLYVCKSLYASRASLQEVAKDAAQTVEGFLRGWLLEPLRDVLKTVRTGSADDGVGVLVRKEGVLADLDVSSILLRPCFGS
jgi:nuclear-control-of-ATPase protein 2